MEINNPNDYGLSYETIMSKKDNVNELKQLVSNNNSLCAAIIMTSETPLLLTFRTLYRYSGWNDKTPNSIFFGYGDLVLMMCYDDMLAHYTTDKVFATLFDDYFNNVMMILKENNDKMYEQMISDDPANAHMFETKFVFMLYYAEAAFKYYDDAVIEYTIKRKAEKLSTGHNVALTHSPRKTFNALTDYIIMNNFLKSFGNIPIKLMEQHCNAMKSRALTIIKEKWHLVKTYKQILGIIDSVTTHKKQSFDITDEATAKELITSIARKCGNDDIIELAAKIKGNNPLSRYKSEVNKACISSSKVPELKYYTTFIGHVKYLLAAFDLYAKTFKSGYLNIQDIMYDFNTFDLLYRQISSYQTNNPYDIKTELGSNTIYFYMNDNEEPYWETHDVVLKSGQLPPEFDEDIDKDVQFLVAIDRHKNKPPADGAGILEMPRIKLVINLLHAFETRVKRFMQPGCKFTISILIPCENASLMVNRNVLLNYASTLWFFMADDDDSPCSILWLSKYIDMLVNEWSSNENDEWYVKGSVAYLDFDCNFEKLELKDTAWWRLLINRVAFLSNGYFVEPFFMNGEDASFYDVGMFRNYKPQTGIKPSIMKYAEQSVNVLQNSGEYFQNGNYIYAGPSFNGYNYNLAQDAKNMELRKAYKVIIGKDDESDEEEEDEYVDDIVDDTDDNTDDNTDDDTNDNTNDNTNNTDDIFERLNNDIHTTIPIDISRLPEFSSKKQSSGTEPPTKTRDYKEEWKLLMKTVPHVDKIILYDIYQLSGADLISIQKERRFFITNRADRKTKPEKPSSVKKWNESLVADPLKLHGGGLNIGFLLLLLCFVVIVVIIAIIIIHSIRQKQNNKKGFLK